MSDSLRKKTQKVNRLYDFKYEYNGKTYYSSFIAPNKVTATRYFRHAGKPKYRLGKIIRITKRDI